MDTYVLIDIAVSIGTKSGMLFILLYLFKKKHSGSSISLLIWGYVFLLNAAIFIFLSDIFLLRIASESATIQSISNVSVIKYKEEIIKFIFSGVSLSIGANLLTNYMMSNKK